jgi:serine/threonine protein phosphatase PrpC
MRKNQWDDKAGRHFTSPLARREAIEAFLNTAARALVESALERGSTDNITVLMVCLGGGDPFFPGQ